MKDSSLLARDDVELISKETRFSGYFQVDEYELRHKKFNGEMTAPIKREIFERGHAVVCLPYDPVRDEVVLIEQFRPGAYANGRQECWMIETIAGIVEEGESFEEVAIRESIEEAGVAIDHLVNVGNFMPSAGGCSEQIVLYIARCDSFHVSGHHGLEEEGEDIRAFSATFEDAYHAAMKGNFSNLPLNFALLWLANKREDLRSQWLGLK